MTPMTMTARDFVRSYNHTLSSIFSHPSLPFTHHSHNWSLCPSTMFLPTAPRALALSPDEALLAIAAGSDILIYSTGPDMTLARTLKGHEGIVTQVEWYRDGERKLVSGSVAHGRQENIHFWDLTQLDSSNEVKIDQAGEEQFVVQTERLDETVLISEETAVPRFYLQFSGGLPGFGSHSLSPDGHSLFYLPTRTSVGVVSTSTLEEKFRMEGHRDAIVWVGSNPDGTLLATSSWDRTVKIWDLRDGSLLRTLEGTEGQNWSGNWSPDGKLIVVGSGDRTVRVWDILSGDTVQVIGAEGGMFSGWVRGLDFDPSDGQTLVVSSWGGGVRVFDVRSWQCTNLYQIDPVASSPFGRMAESAMEISHSLKYAPTSGGRFGFKVTDGRLIVYDIGQNEMWEFIQDKEGKKRIYGPGVFVFAKDGRRVYSGDLDGAVRVWDLN